MERVALDTGFFVDLLQKQETAQEVWNDIRQRRATGIISFVTLYELRKIGLSGMIEGPKAYALAEKLEVICEVVRADRKEVLDRAAQLAHDNELSMANAFVLAAALDRGADRLYTTTAALADCAAGESPDVVLLTRE